jgi:mono/diheme cytochrome c family protein/glucose/arabinose dehydrogenase
MKYHFFILLAANVAVAADDPGDAVLKKLTIPPAPVLKGEDAIKSFKLAPGYRIELVAAEPLVREPVAICWDPDGRLWVCEMTGYMPNVDGTGERDPIGSITVLEDTDGDGKMDKRTIFLDKLVLPRAIALSGDGLLVAENGKLWHCRSTKNDLKCDEKTLVSDYGGLNNPEYNPNGLLTGLDNWIYSSQFSFRLRKTAKGWVKEPTTGRGQWGISQDDVGRLFYNSNSSMLRGDALPCYSPNAHASGAGSNVTYYKSQEVYPVRVTPGINRYYMLNDAGKLKSVTAACGPCIYRGDNLPADAKGNAFVCEPSANLIKRNVFVEEGGKLTTKFAYPDSEFLASTDERFRPVNLANGPDGCLYVVDLYHGILQHKTYMTPYLKKQVLDRGLDKPLGSGRIYRVVHESSTPWKPVQLSKLKGSELVKLLSHPNSWHRETAQRLLTERNEAATMPELKKMLATDANPLTRLHAIWSLEGMGKLDEDTVLNAFNDKDANVRASAVNVIRPFIKTPPDPDLLAEVAKLKDDPSRDVRRQLVFALGLVNHPYTEAALEPTLKMAGDDPKFLELLMAGFAGRESEFLSNRLQFPGWKTEEPWRAKFLKAVASPVSKQKNPLPFLRILHVVGLQPPEGAWRQVALLQGLVPPPPKAKEAAKPIKLPAAPEGIEGLLKSSNAKVKAAAETLAKQLNWPGKDGQPIPVPKPLNAEQEKLFNVGKEVFVQTCAACHHAAGYGEAGKGPMLIDSDWVRGSPERLARMVLHGVRGPIKISGETFNKDSGLEMPAMAMALDDEKVAGVLTYIRREFGDDAAPVEVQAVQRIREANKGRTEQWTEPELLKIK